MTALPRQEFKINYKKLNEYLTNKEQNHEQFYQYLLNYKNEQDQYHHLPNQQQNLQALYLQEPLISQILHQSQQQIFAQIIIRSKEIAKLQQQRKQSIKQLIKLKNKINSIRQGILVNSFPLDFLFEQKLKEIKKQREDLMQKIEIYKLLLCDNIEDQIIQGQFKKEQMKAQITYLTEQSKQKRVIQTKQQLQNQIKQLQQQISSIKASTKQQMVSCLVYRKALQQELMKQDQEKYQFFDLLLKFKTKFNKTKEKNKQLKLKLAKKGLSLPFQIQLNQKP